MKIRKYDNDKDLTKKKKNHHHHLSYGFPLLLISKASDPHITKTPCVLPLFTSPASILSLHLLSSYPYSSSSWTLHVPFHLRTFKGIVPSA